LHRTKIDNELSLAILLILIDHRAVLDTARIQDLFAEQRRANCSIQLSITEEDRRKLLAESERYFNFSKAAYAIPHLGEESVVNSTAESLGISPDQILFLTPNGGSGHESISHHFVAVDNHTNSVVLTFRGTDSASDYIVDATAFTGT
jgi:hypothetical protein